MLSCAKIWKSVKLCNYMCWGNTEIRIGDVWEAAVEIVWRIACPQSSFAGCQLFYIRCFGIGLGPRCWIWQRRHKDYEDGVDGWRSPP